MTQASTPGYIAKEYEYINLKRYMHPNDHQIRSDQSLSRVQLFATP